MRRWPFAVAGAALVAALVFSWASGGDAPASSATADRGLAPLAPRQTSTTAAPDSVPVPETPPSLRGAELDGELGWNPDGSLRIDLALRRRFDHLLSALGEVTLAQVRARLAADVAPVATAAQLSAVLAAFDRYTGYLSAVDRLAPLADPKARLEKLHALRVELLGDEMARAFFEDEERADAWALERRALQARVDLSAEEKAAALRELDLKLPAEARAFVQDATTLQQTLEETAAFEAGGASPEARRAAREARLGAEAAQRLGELDEQRAKWNARLEAFRKERAVLEPLTDEGRRRLDAVLERDFDEPERRRVRALEGL